MEEQCKFLMRGVEEAVREGSRTVLLRRVTDGRGGVRVKLGIGLTASDIHLGFAVVLKKLRQLQDLGHIVCLVIGDFTATMGKPSGRSKTQSMLAREQVAEHIRSHEQQLYGILDPDRTELSYNSDWLAAMRLSEVIALASQHTVDRLPEGDAFATRYASKQPSIVQELSYYLC